MTAKIIASTVNKGGTGKTTISVHLAHYLAGIKHKRVLFVDSDIQGTATQVFIDSDPEAVLGVSSLFNPKGYKGEVYEAETEGILVLPADDGLADLGDLSKGEEAVFRNNIRKVAAKYGADYVVIDTPPTVHGSMLAPLIAADFAFSPMTVDPAAFRGVKQIQTWIERVKVKHNPGLQYLGVLVNRFNKRNADDVNLLNVMQESFPETFIPQIIGQRSAIARIAYSRMPVWAHNTGAAALGAKEMKAALRWITEQMETR